MAWSSNGANAEMNAGINHLVNNQHANLSSITLGDEASSADQGLDETSDRWNGAVGQVATTAHSVLAPYAFSSNASPNGTAGQDFLPGYGSLGTGNGEDTQTFDQNLRLRLQGDTDAGVDQPVPNQTPGPGSTRHERGARPTPPGRCT